MLNKIREIIIDFIFQDTSLIDRLFLKIPIYSETEILTRFFLFSLIFLVLVLILRPHHLTDFLTFGILGHLVNWSFNGHGYQIIFELIGISYSADNAINYVLKLRSEAIERGLHVMIYGSWSSGTATKNSDIDIFIINVNHFGLQRLKLGLLSIKYRLIALFTPLSVDIYVVDRVEYLYLRIFRKPYEKPIILCDPTNTLGIIYGERKTSLEEFFHRVNKILKKGDR
ncbi:MAG: nucleotidyltransferase domain-containing protein [Candidatus Bathyarchaeia archaeon]